MSDMLCHAFAELTARLEDAHSLAVEGQRRDNTSDMQHALIGELRSGMVGMTSILRDLSAMVHRCG